MDDAFEWTESRYDTRETLEQAKRLSDGGFAMRCVWSASRRSGPQNSDRFVRVDFTLMRGPDDDGEATQFFT